MFYFEKMPWSEQSIFMSLLALPCAVQYEASFSLIFQILSPDSTVQRDNLTKLNSLLIPDVLLM